MKGVDSMRDMLPVKVKFANLHLNQLLNANGKVTSLDIFSVVTREMRNSGKLILMKDEELAKLGKGDDFVEFVRFKEVA